MDLTILRATASAFNTEFKDSKINHKPISPTEQRAMETAVESDCEEKDGSIEKKDIKRQK